MKLCGQRASWTVMLSVAGAAAAYFVLFYLPSRRATESVLANLGEKREYVLRADSQRAIVEKTLVDLDKAEAHNDAWRRAAPTDATLSALFGKIHRLARQTGATISRFEPQPVIALDAVRQIPISLTSVGSHRQIAETLAELEQLPVTMWIEDLQMAPSKEDAQKLQCEAKLVIFAENVETTQ